MREALHQSDWFLYSPASSQLASKCTSSNIKTQVFWFPIFHKITPHLNSIKNFSHFDPHWMPAHLTVFASIEAWRLWASWIIALGETAKCLFILRYALHPVSFPASPPRAALPQSRLCFLLVSFLRLKLCWFHFDKFTGQLLQKQKQGISDL